MPEFTIRYDRWSRRILTAVGVGPRWSRVQVVEDRVIVKMGYGFSAAIDRAAIASISAWDGPVWSRGVHGWRGKWLVNGSSEGIVVVTLDPPVRARVIGFPTRVCVLAISLDDPAGFAAAVGCELSATAPPGFQLRW